MMPAWMECMELRPIVTGGGVRGTVESCAVFRARDSTAEVRPGAIATPRSSPGAATAVKLRAVPKSTTMQLPLNRSKAATALATRSAPTSAGFSVVIRSPMSRAGVSRSGALPVSSRIVSTIVPVSGGTTLERIAESMRLPGIFAVSRSVRKMTRYSSEVFACTVWIRQRWTQAPFSWAPNVMCELPTDTARSM